MTLEKYLEIVRRIMEKQPGLGIQGYDHYTYDHDRANLLNEKHLDAFSISLKYLNRVFPFWGDPIAVPHVASLIKREEKTGKLDIPAGIIIMAAIHAGLGVCRLSRTPGSSWPEVIFWDHKKPKTLIGAAQENNGDINDRA